jgi:hypothetical protein
MNISEDSRIALFRQMEEYMDMNGEHLVGINPRKEYSPFFS